MAAIFEITDGTTKVNFIAPSDGFHLQEWNRSIIDFKGGGTFQDSPLAEGRRLVNVVRGNGVETITLKANNVSQDSLIRDEQNLFRLLQKATDFWTSDFQNTPVYLKVLASRETGTRYAIIVNWRIPELPNQFNAPFLQPGCLATLREFDVIIERGEWLALPPATDEAVEVSNIQTVLNEAVFEPGSTNDTVFATFGATSSAINIVGNNVGETSSAGTRFQSVNIPQGATIVDAVWGILPTNTLSGTMFTVFFGEAIDDAPTFVTGAGGFADFIGRTRTSAFVNWNPPAFSAATRIDSLSLKEIVQEIINRDGWVSGNDLVIFWEDDNSPTGVTRDYKPFSGGSAFQQLTIKWEDTTVYGRTSTKSNEVYVSNKYNQANLTHIFIDNNGVFGSNLLNAVLPYDLLPDPFDSNDNLYIGISATSDKILSVFNSVVFDIIKAEFIGATSNWEYYNGAFTALPIIQDNTGGNTNPNPTFIIDGVNSLDFEQPSDWITTTINGVVAYWIRLNMGTVTTLTVVPEQQNRQPYTILQSWVDIALGQILGDIKSINRNNAQNQSGTAANSAMFSNRLIIGARTPVTDDVFVPFLNCSNFQNGSGISVAVGVDTTEGDSDTTTANTERSTFTATDTVQATRVTWSIQDFVSQDYQGEFRVFFRGQQNNKAGTDFAKVNIKVTTGDGGITFAGSQVVFEFTNDWQLLDLGKLRIPASSLFAQSELPNELILELQVQAGTSGDVIYCYDIALIPVSEWAGDFVDKANTSKSILGHRRKLETDSTKQSKVSVRGVIKQTTDDQISSVYQPITNGAFTLQANVAQRLYFLSARYGANDEWVSEPWIAHSIQLFKNERYLAARGNR